jgi:putative ABC transport system substrate-binding protein
MLAGPIERIPPSASRARRRRLARRGFLAAVAAAILVPRAAHSAEARRVIAWVDIDTPGARSSFSRFLGALDVAGTRARHDLDVRFVELDQTDRRALDQLPDRLAALDPWLLVATSLPTAKVAHALNRPALFFAPADAVALQLVGSNSRPGGSMTGYAGNPPSFEKMLGLAAQAFPGRRRIAIVTDRLFAKYSSPPDEVARVGRQLGRDASLVFADTLEEFDAFQARELRRFEAVIVPYTAVPFRHSRHVIESIAKARVPAVYGSARLVREGGLLGVEADISDVPEVFARQVAAIAGGTAPGVIPVERPRFFPVFLNQTTMKALGMKLPASFLKRVEVVVE